MGKVYIGNEKISDIQVISPPVNTADATITAQDVLHSKIAYGTDGKIIGTLPVKNLTDLTVTPSETLTEDATNNVSKLNITISITEDAKFFAGSADFTIDITNLTSSVIKKGTNVMGLTGTYKTSSWYYSDTPPANSLGEIGDICFVTE